MLLFTDVENKDCVSALGMSGDKSSFLIINLGCFLQLEKSECMRNVSDGQ